MKCYEKRTIEERLRVLYSDEDAKETNRLIVEMWCKYKERIDSKMYQLSEKDAILISYGDQVRRTYEAPLVTLKHFLDTHIKDVINSVHILPFYPYSSDDGFSVVDYSSVDPQMGSWREIEVLSEHFRLMFDGVINHCSQYSKWFKAYLNNDPDFDDFFIDLDPTIDLSKVVRPRASPLLHEFIDSNGRVRNIWTTFSQDQVDLNYKNYKVLLAILDALFYYIEKGATLLRLDAIAFIWKDINGGSVHLKETHELIQLMREVLHEVAPEVIIITETNVPHNENVSYFGSGEDEAQMVYNFALPPLLAHSMLSGNTTKMTEWAKTLSLPSDKVCFFNFTASHDGIGLRPVKHLLSDDEIEFLGEMSTSHGGLVSYRDNREGGKSVYELNCSFIDLLTPLEADNATRAKRMMLTQAVMLAMPGVPGIYFHSLVGTRNFNDGVKMTGVNRSINRLKLNIDWLENQLSTEGTLEKMIFKSYKKLLSIRINESAFNPYGAFTFLDISDKLFVIHQESSDLHDHILTIHNFSDEIVHIELPDYIILDAYELISAQKITTHRIELQPFQAMWIKTSVDDDKMFKYFGTSKIRHQRTKHD